MILDAQILTSIQIAIVGVVVVIGMFLIWRSLNKLHEKVEKLACDCAATKQNGGATSPRSPSAQQAYDDEEEFTEEDEELMNAIFEGSDPLQNQAAFMLFSPFTTGGEAKAPSAPMVQIEEVQEHARPQEPQEHLESQEPNESRDRRRASDDGTVDTTAGLSKTKLKKLTVDALKDLLQAKGLSTDGTKNQMVDRLLAASASEI